MKSVKAFFLGVFVTVCSFFSFILGRKIFCNRNSDSGTGRNLSDAESEARRAEELNRDAEKINSELAETSERGARILEEIRNQKLSE